MSWVLLGLVSVLASFWLRWRYKNRRLLAMAKNFPGPPTLPGLGNALKFVCKPEELITVIKELIREYGDVMRFWLGPDLNIVVSDPDSIKTILTNNKNSYKGPQCRFMVDILGGGILSGSGPTWRKHRKIANPNYGKRAIESYESVFNRETDLLMLKLRSIPINRQFDIYECIVTTTSYVVCQTLMGLDKEQTINLPHIHPIIEKTPPLYDIVFDRMTKWYLQIEPIFWMTKEYQQQKQFIEMMTEFSAKIVQHRMETLKNLEKEEMNLMNSEEDSSRNTKLSVIDRFILSQELKRDELLKETFTIFTSSQEASAKISSFTLLMMAYHPDCQEKLYKEIKTVIGDKDRHVTSEDLKQMPYLDMVFKEVLRLFPIGAMLQRTITEDIVLDSSVVPAGASLVIPIYHIHRDPRFWTKPEDFDPERFNPVNTKLRNASCYIPFSLGPMDCLGRYFGTKLIKTIVVRILREFEVTSLNAYKDLQLTIAISTAPVNGFQLMLKPRDDSQIVDGDKHRN
ncbi:cytochrome P450 4C1-like [Galleria mellonella]|uniref:Cytochrome P450 4C1-like n=1 Tax=Galleria mellonella TaxID=7137 RepID=A0ABM3MKK9_GALME|nr:cytochrome P450 4C1-like [Galleria mellonella]XP_052751910.1 cytochrome P450 4C1-like [Galleria mellonella]